MNLLQSKNNQYLREAILQNDIKNVRKYLTRGFGMKAEVDAKTETGGFSMLHCAAMTGNMLTVMTLLQHDAPINDLTNNGYTALDLALWRGHSEVASVLRAEGGIAPIKEPLSLNGKIIERLNRKATVADMRPCNSPKNHKMRCVHYHDGENIMTDLWSGHDYKIIGDDPSTAALRALNFVPLEEKDQWEDEESVHEDLKHISEDPGMEENFYRHSVSSPKKIEMMVPEEGEEVLVTVPPGPLGVLLYSDLQRPATVQGFNSLPGGQKGAIEMNGRVVPGMRIVGINDTDTTDMSMQLVTQLLGQLTRKEKHLRFKSMPPPLFPPTATSTMPAATATAATADPCMPTPTSPVSVRGAMDPHGRSFSPAFTTCTSPGSLSSSLHPHDDGVDGKYGDDEGDDDDRVALMDLMECVHCGVPSDVHTSAACPYK